MKSVTSDNKLIGLLCIILGFLCLSSFLLIDNKNLIIPVTNFFPAKYFLIILIINCGIYLIIFGILNFTGILVSYYSKSITKYEKAKHHVLGIILSIPVWISISSLIFVVSKSVVLKVLISLALIFISWLFYSNLKVLKEA